MREAEVQSPETTARDVAMKETVKTGEIPCEIRPRIAVDEMHEQLESARATMVRLGSIERARRIGSEKGTPSRSMTTMAALSYVPLM
jgi:hypothetical protein